MELVTIKTIIIAIIIAAIVGAIVRLTLSLFDNTRSYADTAGTLAFLLTLLWSLFNN